MQYIMIAAKSGLDRAVNSAPAQLLKRWQLPVAAAIGAAATLASLLVVGITLREQGLAPLRALAGAGPAFWAVFIAGVVVEPIVLCWMMHRIVGSGFATFLPLVRRQALNTLLFGYAGDTWFMVWLQTHVGNARTAFAVVCDTAIVSALVNNAITLLLLLFMRERLQALTGIVIDSITVSLVLLFAAIPFVMAVWRRQSMPLPTAFLMTTALGIRTIVYAGLMAAAWYCAMPQLPVSVLLLLTTARLVICRLPLLPNKDLAFAGLVAIVSGHHDLLAAIVGAIALLTILAEAVALAITQGAEALQRSVRQKPIW